MEEEKKGSKKEEKEEISEVFKIDGKEKIVKTEEVVKEEEPSKTVIRKENKILRNVLIMV